MYSRDDIDSLMHLFAFEMGRSPSVHDMSFLPVRKISVLNHMLACYIPDEQKKFTGIRLHRLLLRARKLSGAWSCDDDEFHRTLEAVAAPPEDLPRLAGRAYPRSVLQGLASAALMGPVDFPPDCAVIARWRLLIA